MDQYVFDVGHAVLFVYQLVMVARFCVRLESHIGMEFRRGMTHEML